MSRIEQIITEIEDYIDSCKFQPLSNTKILVNKEEIEELLVELRSSHSGGDQEISEDQSATRMRFCRRHVPRQTRMVSRGDRPDQ